MPRCPLPFIVAALLMLRASVAAEPNITIGILRTASSSGDREVQVMRYFVDQHNHATARGPYFHLEVLRPPKEDMLVIKAALTLSNNPNVSLVIGTGYTTYDTMVAPLFMAPKIPQLDYSATGPVLSDASLFPYFTRICPSDGATVAIFISVVQRFQWKVTASYTIKDSYGSGMLQVYNDAANKAAIRVGLSMKGSKNPSDAEISQLLAILKGTGVSVTYLGLGLNSQNTQMLRQIAKQQMVGGPYVWFTSYAKTSSKTVSLGAPIVKQGADGLLFATMDLGAAFVTWREGPVKAATNAFGTLGIWDAFAFDAITVTVASIVRIKGSGGDVLSRASVLATLRKEEIPGVTRNVSFTGNTRNMRFSVQNIQGQTGSTVVVGSWDLRSGLYLNSNLIQWAGKRTTAPSGTAHIPVGVLVTSTIHISKPFIWPRQTTTEAPGISSKLKVAPLPRLGALFKQSVGFLLFSAILSIKRYPTMPAFLVLALSLIGVSASQDLGIGVVSFNQWTAGDRVAMQWALNQTRPALVQKGWHPSLHIYGYSCTTSTCDGSEREALAATEKMLDSTQNLSAVIGAYKSSLTRFMYPTASFMGRVPVVSYGSTSAFYSDKTNFPSFARTCFDMDSASAVLSSTLKFFQFSMSATVTDKVSDGVAYPSLQQHFASTVRADGSTLVGDVAIDGSGSTTAISAQLKQFRDATGVSVWIFIGWSAISVVCREAKTLGMQIASVWFSIYAATLEKAEVLAGMLSVASSSEPAFTTWKTTNMAGVVDISAWSAYAADAVTAVLLGTLVLIKQDVDPRYNRVALMNALKGNVSFDGASGHVSFNALGNRNFLRWNIVNLVSAGEVVTVGVCEAGVVNMTASVTWPGLTTSKPPGISSKLKVGILASSADDVYAKLALAAFAYIINNASSILPGYTLVCLSTLAVKHLSSSVSSRYPLFMSPRPTQATLFSIRSIR